MNHYICVQESQPEPTILHAVNLSKVLASDTLHHRRSRRVVNRQLHQSIQPPWELINTSKKVWEERCVCRCVCVCVLVCACVCDMNAYASSLCLQTASISHTSQPHQRQQDEVSVELCRAGDSLYVHSPPEERQVFFHEEHTQPKALWPWADCDGLTRLLQVCIETGEHSCIE